MEESSMSPDEVDSRTERLVTWLIHGSVYIFAIALVALVGVLVLGPFEHSVRQWGWVAGALLAVVGYPLGWVTFPALRKMSRAEQKAEARQPRQAMKRVHGCLAGIVMGIILGLLAWFVIVIFWVSLALSPFVPESWRAGFQTSFFAVSMPPLPTLIILGSTTVFFSLVGVALGLCGKMYRYGPTDRPC